jgi:RecA-family ATPase
MSGRGDTHGKMLGEQAHPSTGRNGKIETFSAADLMALDLPAVAAVVQGLLYVGVTLFAGKPKMGKSWMMLALALAVATGSMALGNMPVQQGEVLYLALEDNRRRLQGRIKKLLAGQDVPAGLHLASSCPRLDEGGLEALDDYLGQHPDIKLVIVDTLARFKPAGSRKRTQYDEDRDSVDSLIPLADKHGVAIVLVHHLREMDSDDPLDMITGSVGLTGGVDSALVLKRRRGEPDAYLYGDGRDYERPVELALK